MFKRLFDLGFATLTLILLSPLFALIGVALLTDSRGPILYKARRVGKGGRLFSMYKFRTMKEDLDDDGPQVTASDDPRITKLGRILRVTKLNELPQLFNVIKGDMRVVGPRPEDPAFIEHYPAEALEILSIRPGITSPASIIYYDEERLLSFSKAADSYVNEILPRKLRLDLLYVRHHSFLLDLDVILHTLRSCLPQIRTVVPQMDEILFGPIQRLFHKYLPWFVIDWIVGVLAIGAAGIIWRLRTPLDVGIIRFLLASLFLASAFSLANQITGVHRTAWNRASSSDAMEIVFSASLATLLLVPANKYLFGRQLFPSGMILLGCMFSLIGFIAIRYRRQILDDFANRWVPEPGNGSTRENIIIVGAGDAAELIVRILQSDPRGKIYRIIGFVDDDPRKRGTRIRGVTVLGSTRRIQQLVRDHKVAALIFAIHNMDPLAREKVLQVCRDTKARVIKVPDIVASLIAGLAAGAQIGGAVPRKPRAQNRRWRAL